MLCAHVLGDNKLALGSGVFTCALAEDAGQCVCGIRVRGCERVRACPRELPSLASQAGADVLGVCACVVHHARAFEHRLVQVVHVGDLVRLPDLDRQRVVG